ncbi:YcaO-like family protein [Paracoccus sp. S4493]|nr:YcaO-like family protein [Paracoccus sp. S4493]
MILQSDISRRVIDLSPRLGAPSLARCLVGSGRVSCATGRARSVHTRALGEACERSFSFSPPCIVGRRRLDTLPEDLRDWFEVLLEGAGPDTCFDMVTVEDISGERRCQMPALLATLAAHCDDAALPYRDSSGTAVHVSRPRALYAAVLEFAERQSLTAFWYFGHGHRHWRLHDGLLGLNDETRATFAVLETWGEVELAEISLFSDVSVILAVLRGRRAPVRFGAGGAGAGTQSQAIAKAVQELYQAVVLTEQLSCERAGQSTGAEEDPQGGYTSGEDALTTGYMTFNTEQGAAEVCDAMAAARPLVRPAELCARPLLHHTDVLRTDASGPALHLSVLHGVEAFPGMILVGSPAEALAAVRYGLPEPIRSGSVPFA